LTNPLSALHFSFVTIEGVCCYYGITSFGPDSTTYSYRQTDGNCPKEINLYFAQQKTWEFSKPRQKSRVTPSYFHHSYTPPSLFQHRVRVPSSLTHTCPSIITTGRHHHLLLLVRQLHPSEIHCSDPRNKISQVPARHSPHQKLLAVPPPRPPLLLPDPILRRSYRKILQVRCDIVVDSCSSLITPHIVLGRHKSWREKAKSHAALDHKRSAYTPARGARLLLNCCSCAT